MTDTGKDPESVMMIGGRELNWQNASKLPCGAVTYTIAVGKFEGMPNLTEQDNGSLSVNSTRECRKLVTPIAARSVDVVGIVVDCGMDLTVSQLYENRESVQKEVYYLLPLTKSVGLYRFEFKIYSPSVSTGPGSREEAFKTLVVKRKEEALGKDSTSLYGNGPEEKNGQFFKAYLGTVKPLQLIQVRLGIVSTIEEDIEHDDNEEKSNLLIKIPSILFPSYGYADGQPEKYQTEGDRTHWIARQNLWFATHADYPVKLFMRVYQLFACDLKLAMPGREDLPPARDTRGYRTSSELDTWFPYCLQASLIKSNAVDGLKIKFSPTFDLNHDARLIVEHHNGHTVAVLSLCYDAEPADEAEVVFLLDQSGSMLGAPMNLAKAALLGFLRNLPTSVKFNVLGFGSDYDAFFKQSKIANKETLEQVKTFVENADAILGGSNMTGALESALGKFNTSAAAKTLVVISDGKLDDMPKVRQYVQQELPQIRVCSIYVGDSGSVEGQDNLREMALLGGGTSQILRSSLDVDDCTTTMIPLFLQQPIKIEDVKFSSLMGNDLHVTFVPDIVLTDHNKLVIYSRTRHNVFVYFKEKELKNSIRATIKLRNSGGEEVLEIMGHESPASHIGGVGATLLFHRLWCQRLNLAVLDSLEHSTGDDDEYTKKQAACLQELSPVLNLMSPFSRMIFLKGLKYPAENFWASDTRFHLEKNIARGESSAQSKSKRRSRIFTPPLRELYGDNYSISVLRDFMLGKEIRFSSSLQLPDGSFDVDKNFCASIRMDHNFLNLSRKKTVSKRSWATCIAFVILENRLSLWSESPECLDEVLAKATAWIKSRMTDEVEVSECIHFALKILWKFFAGEHDRQADKKRQSYAHFYS